MAAKNKALGGPQTRDFQLRNRRGGFRWRGMVPDGNPASLASNEARILINVRRNGDDFEARGGQEKLTTLNFGPVRSLYDARQAVMQRVYWTSGSVGWFDHNVQGEWAIHHTLDGTPFGGSRSTLPVDFFNDSMVVAGGFDNAASILGLFGGSGIALLPLSQFYPVFVAPFPASLIDPDPFKWGLPFFGAPPLGIVAPYIPIVAYGYYPSGTSVVAFPKTSVMGARVNKTDPFVHIFVQRELNGGGDIDIVADPFDGTELLARETIVALTAVGTIPKISFCEPWRDQMILGFNETAIAGAQKIFLRPRGAPPQTWTALAPSSGVLHWSSFGASWKGNFYVFGYDGGAAAANSGRIWKYDGTTFTLIHTIASCLQNFRGVVSDPNFVYFAYYRDDGAGATSVRIASFDGTTWNDTALNLSAQFASDEPPALPPTAFDLPFIHHAGGACLIARGGPSTLPRAYFTVTDKVLGTWRRTGYASTNATVAGLPGNGAVATKARST